MTPETAAAVMTERSAVCSLLSSYDFGPEYTRDRMERAIAAIRARPAPVAEPAGDGVMQALRSIETIASQDGDTFRDFMRPTERMEQILRTARAALADLQRAEG